MNLRRARKIQRESELLSHVRRSVLQSRERRLVLLLVARHGHVNTRRAFVSRQSNVGNRHRRQSRIFQLVSNNLRNLFLESISSSFTPVHCLATYNSVAATRSTMYASIWSPTF